MARTTRLLSLFFCLILGIAQNGLAETPVAAPTATQLGDSTARLAQAVERLALLLETQAAAQHEDQQLRKLDIAISYLNFRSRRIELMEQDLLVRRSEKSRYEDSIRIWQERQELLSREMDGHSPEQRKEADLAQRDFEMRIKGMEQRVVNMEEEIIMQENRIAELQDQLDTAESYVQRHLEL